MMMLRWECTRLEQDVGVRVKCVVFEGVEIGCHIGRTECV